MDTLRQAWEAGFKDSTWARRGPDLAILHGDAEFEQLYPASSSSATNWPASSPN
jgi:hypothetical protein